MEMCKDWWDYTENFIILYKLCWTSISTLTRWTFPGKVLSLLFNMLSKLVRTGDQNHQPKKEMQEGKMVVWRGLINSWEKKRNKIHRRKGKICHLSAEFQRISRRNKKVYLSGQCKKTEENKRMWETKCLFRKIRETKRTFHTKMSTIKGRKCMGLKGAEITKKRWQEHTEELYKKDLHDPDN